MGASAAAHGQSAGFRVGEPGRMGGCNRVYGRRSAGLDNRRVLTPGDAAGMAATRQPALTLPCELRAAGVDVWLGASRGGAECAGEVRGSGATSRARVDQGRICLGCRSTVLFFGWRAVLGSSGAR